MSQPKDFTRIDLTLADRERVFNKHRNTEIERVFSGMKSDEEEMGLQLLVCMQWKNELVKWNPMDNGVDYLEIPLNKIWFPRIGLLENIQNTILHPSTNDGAATLYADGTTTLDFMASVKITCSMNACLFPLDSHKCSMTFVAIGYNISILKLRAFPHPMSKNAKNSNGIWKLEASSVKEVSMPYHSKTKASLQLSVLTYNITASRKPEYYYTTLFVPIGFIFVMTFCAVLLPDDSGERVSLLITCFLAQIVFLDQVYKYLPKTSDYLPLAIQYLFALMFFTSLQIFITSITSSYASQAKKGKSMSSRSQTVFNVLGRVFCSKVKSKIQHKISFRNQSRKEDEVREIHLDGGNIMLVKRAFDGNDQSSENKDLPDRQEPTDRDKRSVTDKKECCRKAVKILDRISMTTSFIFMVLIPLYFALRFGKKVTSDCT